MAMTVLSIMVLMVANIFQSSSESWNIGTQKADMNTAARAALDYMARELQSAVAGPIEKAGSAGATYMTFWQKQIDDIRFLALAHDPDASKNERAVRGVFFWFDNSEKTLKYNREVKTPTPLDCYDKAVPLWDNNPSSGAILITNVWKLYFYVYTNETDLVNGHYFVSYADKLTELPICVDIALEMLSNDDMARALTLTLGVPQDEYVARNSKVYSTRVYFPNRKGYQAR